MVRTQYLLHKHKRNSTILIEYNEKEKYFADAFVEGRSGAKAVGDDVGEETTNVNQDAEMESIELD